MMTEKNRFGICEWVLPESGPAAIQHAARLGFDGIQITEQGGSSKGFPLDTPEMLAEYQRASEENEIVLQALHLWTLCRQPAPIHPEGSPAWQLGIDSIMHAANICAALNIPAIMLSTGFMSQIKNEKDFLRFARFLQVAGEIAGEKDVRIVFESALDAEQILRMRGMVGESMKLCFDTFNPVRFAIDDPVEMLQKLPISQIDHFHWKDGPENCVGCVLLGDGIGRFHDLCRIIKESGFHGWMITENYYLEPPIGNGANFEELAKEDLCRMRRGLS